MQTPSKSRLLKMKKILPYLFIAGIAAFLAIVFQPSPVAVELATVSLAPMTVSIQEEGKTKVRNRYVITAPIHGYLNRILLEEGASLTKDQTVLASLDPGLSHFLDPRTREETKARLKGANALLQQKKAEVERAQSAYALAEKEWIRAKNLDEKNFISLKELHEAEAQVQISKQELNAALFAVEIAHFEREQLEAKLNNVEEIRERELPALTIHSPIDGKVLKVIDKNARYVSAGTPLVEIGNTDDLEVEIQMLSSDAVSIQAGADVEITQWGGDQPLLGKVRLVEPGGFTKISSLGVEEQRVNVHADIIRSHPSTEKLGDRYHVETKVVAWNQDQVLQIPVGALFRKGDKWMTFVVEEGTASLREVRIGRSNGIVAQIVSGAENGDRVILYPPEGIKEGSKVVEKHS